MLNKDWTILLSGQQLEENHDLFIFGITYANLWINLTQKKKKKIGTSSDVGSIFQEAVSKGFETSYYIFHLSLHIKELKKRRNKK